MPNYFLTMIALTGLMVSIWINPQAAQAQAKGEIPAARIAIVNIILIEERSKASTAIRQQLRELRNQFQKEMGAQDKVLQDERSQLETDRALLSSDLFRERRKEMQKKITDFRRLVQERNRQMDQVVKRSMAKFNQVLIKVMSEVASKHKANMVLRNSQLVIAEPSLDITAEVLATIDKVLPTMSITTN